MIDCGWAAWSSVQPSNDICHLIETYGDRFGFIGGYDTNGLAAREDASDDYYFSALILKTGLANAHF